MLTGVSGGLVWLIIFCSYALAFWYGVRLIMDDRKECLEDPENCNPRYDPKSMLVVSLDSRILSLVFCSHATCALVVSLGLFLGPDGCHANWPVQPLRRGLRRGPQRGQQDLCHH